jgi:hypothetical protein
VATSIDQLVRELRGFRNRKAILKELRAGIRKPFPVVRQRIKAYALATLPGAGGLGRWVASSRITLSVKASSRSAAVTVKGGRNSVGGRSDLNAIDRGRVRHPSWGRKGAGQWHTQTVPAGFFTKPVSEAKEWREEIDKAVDQALDQIR